MPQSSGVLEIMTLFLCQRKQVESELGCRLGRVDRGASLLRTPKVSKSELSQSLLRESLQKLITWMVALDSERVEHALPILEEHMGAPLATPYLRVYLPGSRNLPDLPDLPNLPTVPHLPSLSAF